MTPDFTEYDMDKDSSHCYKIGLMSSLRQTCLGLLYSSPVLAFSLMVQAQTITPQGGEFSLLESAFLRGDQVGTQISVNSSGGYIVWQDNVIDGTGLGIGARWIDSTLVPGLFGSFRVNQQGPGDQQNPSVTVLPEGGAAFVWQGGRSGAQNIFIRFLSPNRTFASNSDTRVNVYTNGPQTHPVVASLGNGNVIVVWSSAGQDGSMEGVFGRIVNTNAQFVTAPFRINEFTSYNQRSPAVAVLSNGNFVVTWVSEQQRNANTSDVMGRLYTASGSALGPEFFMSEGAAVCVSPTVAPSGAGGFIGAWSQRFPQDPNRWDIYTGAFASDGTALGSVFRANSYLAGDQYRPKISTLGGSQLLVWTSVGEDGSAEGVFGQLLYANDLAGQPFRINDTTRSKQINPVVVSDGSDRFLVAWSGFTGITNGFDLFAKRYAAGQPLPVPAAPFISALRSSQLAVSWPTLAGYPLSHYEIYMDGATPPNPTAAVTNGNYFVKAGLAPSSSHSFRLAYVFPGLVRSQLSSAATGQTWGEDEEGPDGLPDGIPDDWQMLYWGSKADDWALASADSDGDGASNLREFLAGTNPLDTNSVLKTWFVWTRTVRRLNWNTQPGLVYQVQFSTNLGSWTSYGAPRFAAGTSDSIAVSGSSGAEYYRIVRVR
jgi:hypothetical protein